VVRPSAGRFDPVEFLIVQPETPSARRADLANRASHRKSRWNLAQDASQSVVHSVVSATTLKT